MDYSVGITFRSEMHGGNQWENAKALWPGEDRVDWFSSTSSNVEATPQMVSITNPWFKMSTTNF